MTMKSAALINKKAWSASGTISTRTTDRAVQLQANFVDPNIYTIQFDIRPNVGIAYNAVAEITWSVEGNATRRLISVNSGVCISGSGQAVKVKLYDIINSSLLPFGIQDYECSILVTKGVRPNDQVPVVYAPVLEYTVAAANNIVLNVPINAGIRSIIASAYNVATPTTDVTADVAIEQVSQIGSFVYNPIKHRIMPSIPGLGQLTLINSNAVNPVNFCIMYGIDG